MTTSTVDEPQLIGPTPPPVKRDRMVQAYLFAVIVSAAGDTVFAIGLAWTAVHMFSPGLAGFVLGVEMLPQAICTLFGGVIADRYDTRRVMMLGEFARVAVLFVAAACWESGLHAGAVLFAVAICFGTVSGLSGPASRTLVRQLVHTDDLVTVSGWAQTGSRLARLLGAPLGAVIIHWGFGFSMIADGLTFLGVLIVLRLVVHVRFRLPRTPNEPMLQSLRSGWDYIRESEVARIFLLGLAALNVFVTPVMSVGVALRVSQSQWGSGWLGASEATFAVGAIIGSVIGTRWQGDYLPARSFRLLVLQGVGLSAVGLPTRFGLVLGMTIVGVTAGLASVWLSGSFQRIIAPSHLGRVGSVSNLGDLVLTPATTPIFGLLAGASSVLFATTVCGLAMGCLCAAFALNPRIRQLK
ncbi:MFS transporter [Flexivirga endophytica]|uniref:MFS transporter n=1 Tax=Flexivirga endophytica TaxID=1849103 RepID=A0A916T2M7_9MICO|nr:MFS transporter [Flexivirga endophytica]GGB27586.1 MFS transporter [Flexivirga endophytica]GHB61470.1 MFS transporter [Flexivirga endophytica]